MNGGGFSDVLRDRLEQYTMFMRKTEGGAVKIGAEYCFGFRDNCIDTDVVYLIQLSSYLTVTYKLWV